MRHRLTHAEWGPREYLALVPAALRVGAPAAELARALESWFPESTLYPVNAGRTALRLLLETCRELRPDRSEVVIPSYVCRSVLETVQACGLTAVDAEVSEHLTLDPDKVDAALSPRSLAVIAVHTYASPAPILDIEALCRSRGVFLIDDAAQAFGIRLRGRTLGSFGDAGLLSFAQSKTIVAGEGGALIVSNERLREPISKAAAALPHGGVGLGSFIQFLVNYRFKHSLGVLSYYVRRAVGSAQNISNEHVRRPAGISAAAAGIALAQLRSAERRIGGRIATAQAFHSSSPAPVCLYKPGTYLTRILVELPEGADRARVKSILAAAGVETRFPYSVDRRSGSAARVARLLELPSSSKMPVEQVRRICDELDAALSAVRGPGENGLAR